MPVSGPVIKAFSADITCIGKTNHAAFVRQFCPQFGRPPDKPASAATAAAATDTKRLLRPPPHGRPAAGVQQIGRGRLRQGRTGDRSQLKPPRHDHPASRVQTAIKPAVQGQLGPRGFAVQSEKGCQTGIEVMARTGVERIVAPVPYQRYWQRRQGEIARPEHIIGFAIGLFDFSSTLQMVRQNSRCADYGAYGVGLVIRPITAFPISQDIPLGFRTIVRTPFTPLAERLLNSTLVFSSRGAFSTAPPPIAPA